MLSIYLALVLFFSIKINTTLDHVMYQRNIQLSDRKKKTQTPCSAWISNPQHSVQLQQENKYMKHYTDGTLTIIIIYYSIYNVIEFQLTVRSSPTI